MIGNRNSSFVPKSPWRRGLDNDIYLQDGGKIVFFVNKINSKPSKIPLNDINNEINYPQLISNDYNNYA